MSATKLFYFRLHKCFPNHCQLLQLNKNGLFSDNLNRMLLPSSTLSKFLFTGRSYRAKLFVDHENTFARNVMVQNPSYLKSLAIFSKASTIEKQSFTAALNIPREVNPDKVCSAFETVSNYVSLRVDEPLYITDEMFGNLRECLILNIPFMSDDQLISTLNHLAIWPFSQSPECDSYAKIWKLLDKHCSEKINNWEIDRVLYVADSWFKLRLTRLSNFVFNCNVRLSRKLKKLLPRQLVQWLFYVNATRTLHPKCPLFDIETYIENNFNSFSVDELGIISMSFFKTQNKIKSTLLLGSIIDRVYIEADNVHEITLAAILKTLRYSLPLSLCDKLYCLLSKLTSRIPQLSAACCIHAALAGSNCQLYHEALLQATSLRLVNDISSFRIKDLERFMFVLGLYNHNPQTTPSIFKAIVEEFESERRQDEVKQYPVCLPRTLVYLTLHNIFPKHLISKVLDPDFFRETTGKNKSLAADLFFLDVCLEIEVKDYDGPRIDPMYYKNLSNVIRGRQATLDGKVNHANKFLNELKELASEIFGSKCVVEDQILPHFDKSDIVVCLNADGKAMEIGDIFMQIPSGKIKYPPKNDNNHWIAIVSGSWNDYLNNSTKPTGRLMKKLQHLELIGYNPVVIALRDWIVLPYNARKDFFKNKIFSQCINQNRQLRDYTS